MPNRQPDEDPGASHDADLVARIRAGDKKAMAQLYDRHADVVFGSLVRFLGDREAAEDVAQETFIALWQRAHQFDARAGSLTGWLLAIARNRAIDRLRAARRRQEVSGSFGSDAASHDLGDGVPGGRSIESSRGGPEDDPEAAATRAWSRSVVRSALSAMPEAERQILRLAYDGGLSQSEIARHLGQPLGTVKTRTRRALAELRAVLEDVPDLAPRSSRPPTGRTPGGLRGPR